MDKQSCHLESSLAAYLGFAGNRGRFADLVRLKGVDDRALAHIGIPDEPDADLLLVAVKLWVNKRRK